jgi:putative ABC transport system permease protein
LALVIGLSISMTIARGAVSAKINSVRGTTGTSISVSPAGFFGFQGGGTPLTTTQAASIANLAHVSTVRSSLGARLTSSEISLTSSISLGSLGQQFGGGGQGGFGGGQSSGSFTMPIRVTGTTAPGSALVGGANGGGTETLIAGTVFSATDTRDVAIVGSALATKNSLKVGSTFTAWSTTIKVIGIFDAGSTFANDGVLMPLATVQKLSGQAGQVTAMTVIADNVGNVNTVVTEIKKVLGSSADVTSTAQQVQSQLAPLNSVKTISTYTLVGSVLAAGIILLMAMLMVVRERRREIGVLKALGATSSSVIAQFVAESTTLTILASVVGLGFGVALSSPITHVLISSNSSTQTFGGGFVRPSGGFGGGPSGGGGFGGGPNGGGGFGGGPNGGGGFHFGGFHNTLSEVHTAAGWGTLGFAFLAALVIAMIGSAVAAASVTRVRPAEVLRSE